MNKAILAIATAVPLLIQGCYTIKTGKTLVVNLEPDQKNIVVTSKATVKCQHYVVVVDCKIRLDVQQVK